MRAAMLVLLAAGIIMVATGTCPALEVTDRLGPLPDNGVLVADVAEMSFRLEGAKGLIGNVGGRKTQFLQYLNMSEGFERGPVQDGQQATLGGRIYQSTIDKHGIEPWTTEIAGIEPGRAASFSATGVLHSRFTMTGEAQIIDEGHSRMIVTWDREPAENARMSLMVYLFSWLKHQPLFIVRPDGSVVDQVEGQPLGTWATGVHGVFPAGTRLIFHIGVGDTATFTTHEEATLASFSMGVYFGGFSLTPTDATAKTCQVTIERVSDPLVVESGDLTARVATHSGEISVYNGPYKLIESIELMERGVGQSARLPETESRWRGALIDGSAELQGRLRATWRERVQPLKSELGGGAVRITCAREQTDHEPELRLILPPVHVGQPIGGDGETSVRWPTPTHPLLRTGSQGSIEMPAGGEMRIPLARGQAITLTPDVECYAVLDRVGTDRALISFHFPRKDRFALSIDCGPQPDDWEVESYTERDYVALRRAQPPIEKGLGVIRDRPEPGDLQVVSPYWTVTHSAQDGGSVSQIEFTWGRPGGVLQGPMGMSLAPGGGFDYYCRDAELTVSQETPERVLVVARGHMSLADGSPLATRYETIWEYHPTYLRRTARLIPDEPIREVVIFSVATMRCAYNLNEFVGGRQNPIWGRALWPSGSVYEKRGLPEYMALFERDVQCLEVFPTEDLGQWAQLSGDLENCRWGMSSGYMTLDAYHSLEEPIEITEPVEFSHFIGLPQIPLANREKHAWHMLPSSVQEEEVRRLAWLGCDSVHGLVGDPLYAGTDEMWAKVSERGPELIAKCHKYGLEVMPYLFFLPMLESNPVYAEHRDEWQMQPGSKNQACTAVEGWRDYYRAGVERMLALAPYDGVYYDFVSVYECENEAHSGGPHSTVEGLMETLAATRAAVGEDGMIIGHRGHQPNTVIDSMLDGSVVFEHYSHPHWLPLDELEPLNTFVGASRRDTCVKSLVCSLGGLNPRQRRAEGPRMEDIREIMCKLALQGLFPYAFSMWPQPQVEEFNRLYERFRSVDFERLTFADHLHQSAVRCVDPYSRAAVYFNEDEAYVVIANPESDELRSVNFVVDEQALSWPKGTAPAWSVQPNPEQAKHSPRSREFDYAMRLEGYEYQVFFLRRLTYERPQVVSSTHKWWETEEGGAPAIITRGPLDQPCRLIVACPERPAAITLNGEALEGWRWDDKKRMATIEYVCQATDEAHVFMFR